MANHKQKLNLEICRFIVDSRLLCTNRHNPTYTRRACKLVRSPMLAITNRFYVYFTRPPLLCLMTSLKLLRVSRRLVSISWLKVSALQRHSVRFKSGFNTPVRSVDVPFPSNRPKCVTDIINKAKLQPTYIAELNNLLKTRLVSANFQNNHQRFIVFTINFK